MKRFEHAIPELHVKNNAAKDVHDKKLPNRPLLHDSPSRATVKESGS